MIEILIQTKDRPTELALLLQSFRNQTVQDFNIWILDDASGTPLLNYHFLQVLFNKLRNEGHRVEYYRNNISKGISSARQQMVDWVMSESLGEYFLRVDDDTVCDPDYLDKLLKVIDSGYDIASGVTPPMAGSVWERDVDFVSPVINLVVLNDVGEFLINMDDCGFSYDKEKILLADHFRSSALIKREVHEAVKYEVFLTPCGFREEQFFSFRAILKGFKIGVNTRAINWHIQTPSGGDRRDNYADLSIQNQRLLNRYVKKWVIEYGDFISKYHERNNIEIKDKLKYVNKNTNLLYDRGL